MKSTAYRPPMPQEITDLVLTTDGDKLNATLKAAYCAGWTLQELADIAGVSRERIRQRANKQVPVAIMAEVEALIPAKPQKAPKPRPQPKPIEGVPAYVLAAIKDLQERSAGTNGSTPVDDPRRAVGDELCLTVKAVMDQYGVSVYALSRAVGLNQRTLATRLGSRGLIPKPASIRTYKNTTRTASRSRASTCKRGHDTSFPEARYVGGTGNCKQCSRERYVRTKAA